MQNLSFPPRYMDELTRIIQTHIPDAEIWAFGSRVNNSNHDSSDLDLVIRHVTSPESLSNFKESILNSNIPILLDVLEWDNIPDSFKDEIKKKHIVIHQPRQAIKA